MNKKRKRSNELIFSTLKKLASIDIQKFDKNIKTYELIEDFIQINSDLNGNRFGHTADGRPGWKDGADTVHPFNNILVLMDGTTSAAFAGVSVTNYSTFVLNNFDYSNYSKIRITNMGPYGYQVTCGTQLIAADGTYDVSGLKSDKLQVFYRGNTTNPNIMLRVELIP